MCWVLVMRAVCKGSRSRFQLTRTADERIMGVLVCVYPKVEGMEGMSATYEVEVTFCVSESEDYS